MGNAKDLSIENKFCISCCFYSGIVSLISVFANMSFQLGYAATLNTVISFFAFSFCYCLGRFYNKFLLAKIIFSIYGLIFCNSYWYTNYGSKGIALGMYSIYFIVLVFLWENKQIIILSIIIVLNLLILFLLENAYPQLIPNYKSDYLRTADSYGTMVIYLGIILILILTSKNNYIKQYKLAKQSDMLKSAFLANMSHEIRTPINAIVGFSKLIARKELTKEKKESYSDLILENSNHLLQLLSNILDISMIESGQMNVTLQKTDINEILSRLYIYSEQLVEKSGKKNVAIKTDFPCKQLDLIVDITRLEQILTNFINNAVKFTDVGYIKYGYYIDGKKVIFFVEDTGIGIKENFQPYIFNRFIKGENIDNDNFKRGAGIGLSLSKDIIEKLGGKIWFISHYLEGSTFFISLPLYPTQIPKDLLN